MGVHRGSYCRMRTVALAMGCFGFYTLARHGDKMNLDAKQNLVYNLDSDLWDVPEVVKNNLPTVSRVGRIIGNGSGEADTVDGLSQLEKYSDAPAKAKRTSDSTNSNMGRVIDLKPDLRGAAIQVTDETIDTVDADDRDGHNRILINAESGLNGYTHQGIAQTKKPTRVIYVFLTHDALPLWDVWTEYFRTCGKDSYDIIIHTQKPMSVRGGPNVHYIPRDQIVHGPLRYKVGMIHATLHLYRSALENACGTADASDCKTSQLPDFIQLLSAGCAPIMTCHAVHTYLEAHRDASFVQSSWDNKTNHLKGSQWVTLTGAHALELIRYEDELIKRWTGFWGGAPDELAIPEIMNELELPIHNRVLTFALFWFGPGYKWLKRMAKKRKIKVGQVGDYSHPGIFQTSASVALIMSALKGNHTMLFARKIEPGPASEYIIDTLKVRRKALGTDIYSI